MAELDTLREQALQTYERITRRLNAALEKANTFPPRGLRTTAYVFLQAHIERLHKIQEKAHKRYRRREVNTT